MKSLKGKLLVAAPSLLDPNFHKTVVLMLEHSEEGAGGFVLNRSSEKTVRELWSVAFDIESDWEKPIYFGGPVTGPLSALHGVKELADRKICHGVYCAMTPAHLQELVERKQEPSLFVANYAGWGAGQLERELKEDAWLVHPARAKHIFWDGDKDLWSVVMDEIYAKTIVSSFKVVLPRDASLN